MIRDLKEAADTLNKKMSRGTSPNRTIESIEEERPEWDPDAHEVAK
jgi:hypothetical protein